MKEGQGQQKMRFTWGNNLRFVVSSLLAGLIAAAIVFLFVTTVNLALGLYGELWWLAWLLPAAGLVTFGLYRMCKVPYSYSTRQAVACVSEGGRISILLVPSIFVGVCLTLLTGGSVGVSAGAIQIGAAVGSTAADLSKASSRRRTAIMMCAASGALCVPFGAPIAAGLFIFEAAKGRRKQVGTLLLVFATTVLVWLLLQVVPCFTFKTYAPIIGYQPLSAGFFLAVVAACALAAIAYSLGLSYGRKLIGKIPVPSWVKLLVGGALMSLVIVLLGGSTFSGTGYIQMVEAWTNGMRDPFFLGKLVLTVTILSIGFKGGEVLPMLCIGSTLGAYLAVLMGADPAMGAALGLVVLVCGTGNCPLAAVALGCELFGLANVGWFVLASAIAFVCTSWVSLYENEILLWKLARRRNERS